MSTYPGDERFAAESYAETNRFLQDNMDDKSMSQLVEMLPQEKLELLHKFTSDALTKRKFVAELGVNVAKAMGDTWTGPASDFHQFETGAKRSEVIGPRYDLIPEGPLRRLALRYTLGAQKYGEYNWQKGLPLGDTFNHIFDHLLKAKRQLETGLAYDDDDLAGAAWGILALMFFQDRADYSKGN